jgi:hypothetical protein
MTEQERDKLKTLLKDKLNYKKNGRCNKKQKQKIFNQTLESFGIDVDKFKEDVKAVQKQGGLKN